MNVLRFNILSLLLIMAMGLSAQVRVEVASKVNAGNKFQVAIIINEAGASAPSQISIPNCRLLYPAAVTTQISAIQTGGKMERKEVTKLTYTFLAEKEGTVEIAPVTVSLASGKTVKTESRKLTIVGSGQRLSGSDRTSGGADINTQPEAITPDSHFSANDMFVRIILDKKTVYEQQPVVATIKLYSRLNMNAKFQLLTQPTFEGFLSEEINVNSAQGFETVDGKSYNTFIVKRCVLYPQKSGKLKVTSGTYEITLEDIVPFNVGLFIQDHRLVTKTVKTPDQSATVDVLPLPQPQPAGFDGAVGSFSASASLSSTNMRTNDPVTYTVKITGKGNIKYLKTPKLDLPPGFDQYTPKTDIDASYTGGDVAGTYTATYTIVPQEVGKFEIPPLKFSYFNPQTRQYNTIDLQGYNVDVTKGDAVADKAEKSKRMTDILTINRVKGNIDTDINYIYRSLWYWMLYIAITLLFISFAFAYRRHLRLNADVKGRRLARAMRQAMKRFKTARAMMEAHNPEKFYTEINKALTGYISDKLGLQSSQLIRDNISAELESHGLDKAGADKVIDILDQCEMARFTPSHSDADMSSLYKQVVEAARSIENTIKQKQ